MNILVTGAQFKNKGAQSLLFSVMSDLRKRYGDDTEIYYLPIDDCFNYRADNYRFNLVFDDLSHKDHLAEKNAKKILWSAKRFAKWVLEHKEKNILRLSAVWKKTDVVVDVSGYALSDKFGAPHRYIRHLDYAKKMGIPIILMPQSFGPFNYNDEKTISKLSEALNSASCIFAREKEGVACLKEMGVEKNVIISPDLVLQSDEVEWDKIFKNEPELSVPKLPTNNNVGIIPNTQLYKHGKKEDLLKLYQKIINKIVETEKNVYIFRHSNDLPVCEDIYAMFESNDKVNIIRDDLNCLEYSEFICQFDFVVASRFHAIVHAYREGTPAFVLGWAIKYQNLAATLGQERYVFDGTDITEEKEARLMEELEYMINNCYSEKETVNKKMVEVRNNNCYDKCKSFFEGVK